MVEKNELELLKIADTKDLLLTFTDVVHFYLKWMEDTSKLEKERPLVRAFMKAREDLEISRVLGDKFFELDKETFLKVWELFYELTQVGTPEDLMKKSPEERMAICSRLENLLSETRRVLQR